MPNPTERSELFVSCDLVGSTSYKQRTANWQDVFLTFYREFPQMVGTLAKEDDEFDGAGLEFDLWKAIGDELIFNVHVRKEEHVYLAVKIWLSAMRRYEDEVLSDIGMATKGGAFIATFPGPDSEATVPRNPTYEDSDLPPVVLNDQALKGPRAYRKYLFDYFGPSIDTGFRVISACSPRYFTLSVEVALAIFEANVNDKERYSADMAVYRGGREFKGVWNGRAYPLFALDRNWDDKVNTALRTLEDSGVEPHKAIDVCRQCLATDGWASGIYLPDSGKNWLREKPVDSLAGLRNVQSESTEGREQLAKGDPDEGESLPEHPPTSYKNAEAAD